MTGLPVLGGRAAPQPHGAAGRSLTCDSPSTERQLYQTELQQHKKREREIAHPKFWIGITRSLCTFTQIPGSAIQQMPYHLGNGYTRVASLRSEVLRPTAALSFAVAQQLAGHVALPVSTTTAKRFVDWWRIPV